MWIGLSSIRTERTPVPVQPVRVCGSHHKLIRYGLITNGCIDGNTRAIIYLGFNDSNKSSVVLKVFKVGIEEFQLPSQVRGNRGGNMQHIIIINKLS